MKENPAYWLPQLVTKVTSTVNQVEKYRLLTRLFSSGASCHVTGIVAFEAEI